eukprot:COSAG01_NODE_59286_length_301_cov_0.727723_1_plen_26_part_01
MNVGEGGEAEEEAHAPAGASVFAWYP